MIIRFSLSLQYQSNPGNCCMYSAKGTASTQSSRTFHDAIMWTNRLKTGVVECCAGITFTSWSDIEAWCFKILCNLTVEWQDTPGECSHVVIKLPKLVVCFLLLCVMSRSRIWQSSDVVIVYRSDELMSFSTLVCRGVLTVIKPDGKIYIFYLTSFVE